MRIDIKHPTRADLVNFSPELLDEVKKELTYINSSIRYQLNKIKKNLRFKNSNYLAWEASVQDLQSKLNICLMFNDLGRVWIRPGSLANLECLRGKNIPIYSKVEYPAYKPYPWAKIPKIILYSYQKEAIDKLMEAKHGSVELSVGLGKSAIMLFLTRSMGLRTLVVVPSQAIFLALAKDFQEHLGKGNVGLFGDGKKQLDRKITIAIAKSLTTVKPLSKEAAFLNTIQAVISDEAHTNPSTTNEKVFHDLLSIVPYRFFLSGTQTRGDGAIPLLKSLNGLEVMNRDTKWGIQNGYLCPLQFKIMKVASPDPHYYNSLPLKMKQEHIYYNPKILDFVAKISQALVKAKGETSLILVEEIKQISELLKRIDIPVAYCHGNTIKKEELEKLGIKSTDNDLEMERFNRGEVKILIGTSCVSTGTNLFSHHTFNLQGGSSFTDVQQGAVGRSVRRLKGSKYESFHPPKDVATVWDFDIKNIEYLYGHLMARTSVYKQTGGNIQYLEVNGG
jgi:superfamily II DNA or RNA helicase